MTIADTAAWNGECKDSIVIWLEIKFVASLKAC